MKIYDFNDVTLSGRMYGGLSGLKLGIILDNEYWILKFPKNTKNFDNVDISYTTSPLSEYLGSHIYEAIGIDVHKTRLGIKDKKLVVACRDFKQKGEVLYEFREIKNEYVKNLEEKLESSTTSNYGMDINELMLIMNNNPTFIKNPNLKKRFWIMFLIDAFIGNNDRNNGNWGILFDEANNTSRLAPVYDNGASFSSKLSDEKIFNIMNNEDSFKNSVYLSRVCSFYEFDKKINPLKYIEKMNNLELNEVILEIVPKINLDKIHEIIYELPNYFDDIEVISEVKKDFYYKSLEYRYNEILIPIYNKLKDNDA